MTEHVEVLRHLSSPHLVKIGRLPLRDQAALTSQLSALLQAGVGLSKALGVLSLQAKDQKQRDLLGYLVSELQRGNTLGNAVRSMGDAFDPLVGVTIEVGEGTGRLGMVLSQLGEYFERLNALRRKTMQAMVYPALVLSVAVLAVVFLLIFIVPAFADMFRGFQVELPDSTKAVLALSTWITDNVVYVVAGLFALGIVVRYLAQNSRMRTLLLEIYSAIPAFGSVYRNVLVARFSRTMGTLLESRVPMLQALEITRGVMRNPQLQLEIQSLVQKLKQGKGLGEEVAVSKWFPPIVAQMIIVGEETSEIDKMLLRIAGHYEKEVNDSVDMLTSVIEPIIVLFLGIVVAILLVTMYLPMFELVNLSAVN